MNENPKYCKNKHGHGEREQTSAPEKIYPVKKLSTTFDVLLHVCHLKKANIDTTTMKGTEVPNPWRMIVLVC